MNTEIDFEIAGEKIKTDVIERLVFLGEYIQDIEYKYMSTDIICIFLRLIDNMMTYCEDNLDYVPMDETINAMRKVYLKLDTTKGKNDD